MPPVKLYFREKHLLLIFSKMQNQLWMWHIPLTSVQNQNYLFGEKFTKYSSLHLKPHLIIVGSIDTMK